MTTPLLQLSRNVRILVAALLGYVGFLFCLAATFDDVTFRGLFSEEGFFEECSIIAWMIAAVVVLRRAWQSCGIDKASYLAHAVLFLLCAMREADWHKKFTADGILKIKYYTRSAAALSEKIPAALISLLFITLVIHGLVRCFRYAKIKPHLSLESTWVMMTGISLFFVGKILDRSISVLTETFGVTVSPFVGKIIAAQEEGLEMVGPLFIALAFFWPANVLVRTKAST
jgi:hypothetical protein